MNVPSEIIKMLEYGIMAPYSNIFCFSTTRQGGVSKGNYASLNCTPYTGDDAQCVQCNQQLLCSSMPQAPKELIIPFQTHSTNTLVIDDGYLNASPQQRNAMLQDVDALITKEPNCCICVSTADCIPIMIYDSKRQAVAAIHAGWRGTVNRITSLALRKMQQMYGTDAKDIIACIGPSISMSAFEVGEEVYETFREKGFVMHHISQWKPETHKHHIDLWRANRMELTEMGVPEQQIETSGVCTYTKHNDYFSARRLGIRSGRILSGIMIMK